MQKADMKLIPVSLFQESWVVCLLAKGQDLTGNTQEGKLGKKLFI